VLPSETRYIRNVLLQYFRYSLPTRLLDMDKNQLVTV
jgi:hypothetical protein